MFFEIASLSMLSPHLIMLVISLTAEAVGDAIQPIRAVALEIVPTTKNISTIPGTKFVRKIEIANSSPYAFSLLIICFTSFVTITATTTVRIPCTAVKNAN